MKYNPLTEVVVIDRLSIGVYRKNMAFQKNSLCCQIHRCHLDIDGNNLLALTVAVFRSSTEDIPFSNNQVHHTKYFHKLLRMNGA
jgi:hypothetical protein